MDKIVLVGISPGIILAESTYDLISKGRGWDCDLAFYFGAVEESGLIGVIIK